VNRVIKASYDSWIKSTIWSGRPLRALSNPYIADWEQNRQAEIKELTDKGVVPLVYEIDRLHQEGKLTDEIEDAAALRYVMFVGLGRMNGANNGNHRPIGVVGGSVNKAGQTAANIVEEMVRETVVALNGASGFVTAAAKL
jgi:NAD(P)H-dependent flavin oxidoreductase YrpB (nitropropane dioxygenase family)